MGARLPGDDLGGDVLAAVVLFGGVEVVGPAAKGEVRRERRATQGEGVKVMKLELVAGGAAVAGGVRSPATPHLPFPAKINS